MATRLSDPIGFELFKNTLLSIADEMALTILRTAYSGVLKDNMDYSTAFCDAEGRTVAQGLTLPGHLSSFPDALAATIRRYGDRMRPGDVYALNDPFEGGMHLPDVFILKPIFHEGRRVAFAATICHQTDMGGRVAGSNASDSTEIFQEGLRIPPVKMYDAGEPNETFFRMLEKNVRLPVRVLGDMRAQLAACHIAEQAFARLIAKHGVAQISAYMEEILDYTERLTRAAIAELPDGEWSFTDWIDDDGIDFGTPIPLTVALKKHGDQMTADWDGHLAPGEGRHQQHVVVHPRRHLHLSQVGPAPRDPLQRRLLPRHRGHRAARHDRQRGGARGLRGARTDRLPHGRHRLRRPRPDAARPCDRGLRGRQHRRQHRRLSRRSHAVHLRGVHLLGVGRSTVGRRTRRQRQSLREHVAAVRGGDRDRAAARDPLLRADPRRGRAGPTPRRDVDPPRLPAHGGRGCAS